jgi:SAM-dependent methyltransferase
MPYIKEVFDVTTFEQAKHVVLTSDPDNPKKFENETNFLVNTIAEQMKTTMDESSIVLDFGCGMGRVAKELINKFNCKVIGLDISRSMLTFAKLYTANIKKFEGTHSYTTPDSVDVALSILALQHSENPAKEIDNIINVLKVGGTFILLNEPTRYVPSDVDSNRYVVWKDDGFDIFNYIEARLTKINNVPYISGKHDIIFYRKER